MNNAWTTEFTRVFLLMASTLVIGFSSGYWLFPIVAHFLLYIIWIMVQLRSFERWIRNCARSADAPSTNGIWGLIGQHIYRTQKKNSEQKQKLASLARRYQAIMEALPDATIVLNEAFEIEWANLVAEQIIGIDIVRDTGQRVDSIIRDSVIQDLLNGKESVSKVEIKSPIDQHKTLVVTKVQYGDNQTLLIARDISQRIALHKMRKAFIANASHELRTPLTVVSGYLEMLASDEELPNSVNKLVANAHQQAVRMDRILDDLLTLSKLEEKGFSKDTGDVVDVPGMLKRMIADLNRTGAEDSHNIQLKMDDSLKLKVIEREIFSLCQNLLTNAIKYSDNGSIIKVSWELTADGCACLRVEDNGEGIAPEHLSRLTERFYRVNISRSRKVNGTGLGLSIARHIMENYGGSLNIQSELNVGSTFSACFPNYRVEK